MKIRYLIIPMVIAFFILQGCSTSRFYSLDTMEFDDIDYGFPTKKVQVRNISIGLIDTGQGDQVIVLIHGLGSNAKSWIKNISALAEKYRVIALDLPGYGKSDKGYYQYSMDFYADVVAELLGEMAISKATLIGHSMGGQIAMYTALKYPDKTENLVLISPAGFERFTPGEGAWMRKAVSAEFVHDTQIRNIDINARATFYEMPEWAEFIITDRIQIRSAEGFDRYCYAVSKNVAAMLDGIVWDRLDQIKNRTLIIFGEQDGLIPNAYLHGGSTSEVAAIGAREILDNKLVMIPECGHFVQVEKPDQTNTAILDFLTEK